MMFMKVKFKDEFKKQLYDDANSLRPYLNMIEFWDIDFDDELDLESRGFC